MKRDAWRKIPAPVVCIISVVISVFVCSGGYNRKITTTTTFNTKRIIHEEKCVGNGWRIIPPPPLFLMEVSAFSLRHYSRSRRHLWGKHHYSAGAAAGQRRMLLPPAKSGTRRLGSSHISSALLSEEEEFNKSRGNSTENAVPKQDQGPPQNTAESSSNNNNNKSSRRRNMDLFWCSGNDFCKDVVRERVVGDHNQIVLSGPATGQVVYQWRSGRDGENEAGTNQNNAEGNKKKGSSDFVFTAATDNSSLLVTEEILDSNDGDSEASSFSTAPAVTEVSVLVLVKPGDEELMKTAAIAIQELIKTNDSNRSNFNLKVLLDPTTAARLAHYHGVDGGNHIGLFEELPTPGFGSNLASSGAGDVAAGGDDMNIDDIMDDELGLFQHYPQQQQPDLICTLGGDGGLMHAASLFQGPSPPILSVAGGSLGFLTPFRTDEMVPAVLNALGMIMEETETTTTTTISDNNLSLDYDKEFYSPNARPAVDNGDAGAAATAIGNDGLVMSLPGDDDDDGTDNFNICLSIRMRLECRILNAAGACRARYNVLNEVVIDRGISPYLAALECFCDDVHLTTVQADGVIFATPTGSTAYAMAAGSSVVHPAVPCILVTPICPHVLSFRSMVFPDHVVLRCFMPDDSRAETAAVAFDGKHRQELRRGDSVEIKMSPYPVPTINRVDHSSDWLTSLKRNLYFNARPRQRPL